MASLLQTPKTSVPILLLLIAATAICAGSLARLYDLDRMVVWHDEVFSLLRISGYDGERVRQAVLHGRELTASDLLSYQQPSPNRGFAETLSSLMSHPEHSPLFFLVAWVATPLSASSLEGVRGTSAGLSLLLAPALFWLARELYDDSAAAWIAAALAACSPMHLLYAQEARPYALWTLLAAMASAALLRALRKERVSDWTLYGLLVALGLYTHLLFALVLAAHAAYLALQFRRGRADSKVLLRGWGAAVAAAVLLFSPWIALMAYRADHVVRVTSWMELPVPVARLLEAWGLNLVRVFADFPAIGAYLLLGLIPLAWVLWRFGVRAPRSAVLFASLVFLALAAPVLVPDLIQGGRRSLHPRYLLPAFLALELAAAFVLATGWQASAAAVRAVMRTALVMLLGLGLWSQALILRADTWWSKNLSAKNREVAALVSATERPLLILSESGVALGEAISLAYFLDERLVIHGDSNSHAGLSAEGFTAIFLLTPSAKLRAALSATYDVAPVLNTWQWYRALPKAIEEGT